jgi:hypothetical protein
MKRAEQYVVDADRGAVACVVKRGKPVVHERLQHLLVLHSKPETGRDPEACDETTKSVQHGRVSFALVTRAGNANQLVAAAGGKEDVLPWIEFDFKRVAGFSRSAFT